jgi:hypothetical protein
VRVSTEFPPVRDDHRLGQEGAGDRDQLFLPGADVRAFIVDNGVVPSGSVRTSGRRAPPAPCHDLLICVGESGSSEERRDFAV